ncbi:MAG: DnaJ domain-containing protein [Fusobacterium sp.]
MELLILLMILFVGISLFMMFGFIIIKFFPIILIIIIYNMIKNRNRPKRTRTYYYKTGNQQDFEDFFKNYTGQSGNYYNGSNGNGSRNTFGSSPFEDKSKYYRTLGIQEGASKEEIKKAFREKAKMHHPDKFSNEPENIRNDHEEKFKKINEAYNKLNN